MATESEFILDPSNPFRPMLNPAYVQAQGSTDNDVRARFGLQPVRIGYNSWLDSSGNLLDKYKLSNPESLKKFDEVTMDPTALNMIKEQAFNKGPSSWAQLQNYQQRLDEQNKIDQLSKQMSGSNATSLASLMSAGGAGSGSRERLAQAGVRNAMFNRNAITRGGMSDRTNIGLADQANKSDLLKALPGYESQVADLKMKNNAFDADNQKFNIQMLQDSNKFNLTNALKGVEAQNTYNQNTYAEQMKAWAANKQAEATQNSGK